MVHGSVLLEAKQQDNTSTVSPIKSCPFVFVFEVHGKSLVYGVHAIIQSKFRLVPHPLVYRWPFVSRGETSPETGFAGACFGGIQIKGSLMQNKLDMMMVVIFLFLSLVEHHGRFPNSMSGLAVLSH